MTPFAESLKERIEAEYESNGYGLGWRLLYSPCEVLDDAEVAFLGMNPGGSDDRDDHPRFCMPVAKSAYVNESWHGQPAGEAPLQRQVRMLFDLFGQKPEAVLAGNIVPFRSRDWKSLSNKGTALEIGIEIWRSILERAEPRLVITMGNEAREAAQTILGIGTMRRVVLGWGAVTGRRSGRLVALPHLSRFRVIGREASEPGLRTLFEGHLP